MKLTMTFLRNNWQPIGALVVLSTWDTLLIFKHLPNALPLTACIIGAVLNLVAIFTNGGKMPFRQFNHRPRFWRMPFTGFIVSVTQLEGSDRETNRHKPITTETRFVFLCDIIPTYIHVASIGDLIIAVGLIWWIVVACR
jgi:ABC-type transport system involved in cytochrome bd biosynthesis fused ATPase/permease subunit